MMPVMHEVVLAISSSLVASIVVKATIAMALGLIGAWFARRNRAAVRHALLAASFGVLLVLPVASIVTPPVRIVVPAVGQNGILPFPLAGVVDAVPPIAPADGRSSIMTANAGSSRFSLSGLLVIVWFAGTMLSLLPMALAILRIRSLRRAGLPWSCGQSVVDGLAIEAGIHRCVEVLLHEALSGPMTCGAVHPAIVLPPDAQTWASEDLNRAMVHELEHVRRGDHVSHCFARAVCAVYWFHPLVWMAWRQLALEAERACDDAVLRRFEATAYADQLVGLARRLSMAKSPLLAMANRTDLAARVRAVLDGRQRRGRAGAYPVALASAAAAVLALTLSPLRTVAAPQSTPAQLGTNNSQTIGAQSANAAIGKFDAVSVKLVSSVSGSQHSDEHSDPGRLRMTGSLHRFIIRAYGITDHQLGGEPTWFKTNLYSIEAVTSAPARLDQMMLMLREGLAERFQLKLRQEDREAAVYLLEVAAGGPKFKELKPGEVSPDEKAPRGIFSQTFTSVDAFVNSLNGMFGGRLAVDRPVVDRTHLTGSYAIHLQTDIEEQNNGFGRTFQFPNLFHDIQSELGLKIVPGHARIPYFIVDHAATPTPN